MTSKKSLFNDILYIICFMCTLVTFVLCLTFLITSITVNKNITFDKWVWLMLLVLISVIGTGALAGILKLIDLFDYQNNYLEDIDEIESIGENK